MNKKHFWVLFLTSCFVISTEVAAQHYQSWVWFKRKQYWSVGASLNAMNYFGDITPQQNFTSMDIRYTRPSFSIFAQRRLKPNFTARVMFTYGRVAGDDATADPKDPDNQFRFARNLHFRNDIFELNASGILDFVGNRGVFYQRPSKVIPYLTFGIGVFYHNPQAIAPKTDQVGNSTGAGGEWVDLQPLGTEGQGRSDYFGTPYSRFQVCFPVGLGIRYKINSRMDIGLEIAYRFMATDYLDDVSRDYVDLGIFGNNNLARAMSDRSGEGGRARLTGTISESFLGRPDEYYVNTQLRNAYLEKVGLPDANDGVLYPTYGSYGSPGGQALTVINNRGNAADRDVYITTAFQVSYIIPGQVRCPEPFKKRFRRHRL
jgi:hypothetical protein